MTYHLKKKKHFFGLDSFNNLFFSLQARAVDIERTDSGVGSESSQASSGRGVGRRWRTGNTSTPGKFIETVSPVSSGNIKVCEDCEQRLESLISDR